MLIITVCSESARGNVTRVGICKATTIGIAKYRSLDQFRKLIADINKLAETVSNSMMRTLEVAEAFEDANPDCKVRIFAFSGWVLLLLPS